jgi:N-acetylglucosamine malate deacetylase 1
MNIRRMSERRKGLIVGIGRWLFKALSAAFMVFALVCILKAVNNNPREIWVAAYIILLGSMAVFAIAFLGKYLVCRWRPPKGQEDSSLLPRKRRTRKKLLTALLLLGILLISWGFYIWHFQTLPQAIIHLIGEIQAAAPGERILVFSPHPDDETIAAGGYIAASVKAEASVWIVLVTDGDKNKLMDQRYQEFKEATNILGVPKENLFFLGYPDGFLKRQDLDEMRSRFLKIVSQVQPDIIIAPHPDDRHPDHRITGVIVASIAEETAADATLYQYFVHEDHFPNPRTLVPEGYILPSLRMILLGQEWIRFMLTQNLMELKQEAVLEYRTQLSSSYLRSLLFSFIRQNELFLVPGD